MKKSLAERFEEMVKQNVPDETLTRAFDEGDSRVIEEYAAKAPRKGLQFGFRREEGLGIAPPQSAGPLL